MGHSRNIAFPDRPAAWYDVERHTITFPVLVDDKPMACIVAASSLMKRFANRDLFTPLQARAVYEEHKDALRRLAEADIRGRAMPHGVEEFTIPLLDDDLLR